MFTDVDKKAHSDRGVQKLAVKFDVLSEVICRVAELKTQDAKQVELGGRERHFAIASKTNEEACPLAYRTDGSRLNGKRLCRISPKNLFWNA